MVEDFGCIVVGGGHNALVCAAYLARAGLKVTVLERQPYVGGACITDEVWPGYKVSVAAYILSLLQPKVILDLDLKRHGYEVLPTPPVFQPFPDGRTLIGYEDINRTCQEMARFSKKDAARYPDYVAHLDSLIPFIRRFLWETPPTIGGRPRDALSLLKFVWRFRDAGRKFNDIYDLLTLSVNDYLSRWFESDEIRAAFSGISASGSNAGPMTPGSAFVLMRGLIRDHKTAAGGWGFVRGGMGAVTAALSRSARAAGAVIRTDAEVDRILVRDGKAVGVVLKSGQEMRARCVIANAHAKVTFLDLVPQESLRQEFRASIEHFRVQSSCFKINLALDSLPKYSSFDAAQAGFAFPSQIRIAPSVRYIEEAFDASKYGGLAQRPYMFVTTPTSIDDTLAPAGKHIVGILAAHVSYDYCKAKPIAEVGQALLKSVVDELGTYAPGLADRILHAQVLSPVDIESRFALPGGHVHHGELTVDQIFLRRPAPGAANYRAPIPGLYLSGASAHPGGGVTGVPGHNAAREILRDVKAGRLRL